MYLLLLALLIPQVGTAPADSDTTVVITEWTVPWEDTRPRDPYVGPEGHVWFVGQRGNYAAHLDPETGEFERIDLPEGAGPHNLIVANDGTAWYAGNRDAHIGRIDPETGEITKFPMPNPAARDPHTLVFGPEGDIWFTVQGGNFVGKFLTGTGHIELISVPTPEARPYGIVVTEEGRPWFTEFGTDKLATVDPETMELTEIVLPREEAHYADTPPPAHTGGFGEPTCQACHFGNELNAPGGELYLKSIPEIYLPDSTYRITIALSYPEMERSGFELSARFLDGSYKGKQAGALRPVDSRRTGVTRENGIEYVHLTLTGAALATPGSARWTLLWTAPDTARGPVIFHASANAANHDDSAFGDYIYAASAISATLAEN